MEKVRVGIIGCGGIANNKHLPSLSRLETVELAAFCDIIAERAEKAAAEYGIEGAGIYEDYRQMLAEEKLDVVHVCTPNNAHAPASIGRHGSRAVRSCARNPGQDCGRGGGDARSA